MPDPKYISQVEMPDGSLLEIKDTTARQMATGGTHYIGKLYVTGTSPYTHLTDGDTRTSVEIIDTTSTGHHTVSITGTVPNKLNTGDIVLDDGNEFIFDGSAWEDMGADGLGAFAFVDEGRVTVPTVSYGNPTPNHTSTAATVNVTSDNSGGIAAPTGTFTQPSFSKSVTFTGTTTSENETKVVNNSETIPSGATSYTPKGSIAAPTISVSSAGSTTTVKNPSSKNVVTAVSSSDPSSTAVTGAMTYMTYTENTETLSFKQIAITTGASITTSDVTVKTGDATYTASHGANDFTGTAVYLTVQAPKATGSAEVTGTVSGTTSGGSYVPDKVSVGVNYDKTTSVTQGTETAGTVTKVVTPYTGT